MIASKKNKIKIIISIIVVGILSTIAGLIMAEDEWVNMGIFIITMLINLIILGFTFNKIKNK